MGLQVCTADVYNVCTYSYIPKRYVLADLSDMLSENAFCLDIQCRIQSLDRLFRAYRLLIPYSVIEKHTLIFAKSVL